MQLAVEYPRVSYRDGSAGVACLAKAIEEIGVPPDRQGNDVFDV